MIVNLYWYRYGQTELGTERMQWKGSLHQAIIGGICNQQARDAPSLAQVPIAVAFQESGIKEARSWLISTE